MADFVKVAQKANLADGEKLIVNYDGAEVGLAQLDGEIYAVSNVCPHDDGPLFDGPVEGDCIVCPRHGARFNLKTSKQTFPAFSFPPKYDVKVEGDDILIAPAE